MLGGFMLGMADMTPQQAPAPAMANPMAAMSGQMAQTSNALAPKKPGINWLGVIADALAGAAGREGPYAAQMQRQREMDYAAQQGQQERMNKRDDWQWQKQWELDHPNPINNDTVNDYQFILQQSGKDAADQYLQGRYDPVVNIPLGDGRTYIGPRSGAPSAVNGLQGGQTPQRPVGKLTPIGGGVGGNPGGGFPG
jgi:hypothetical protein